MSKFLSTILHDEKFRLTIIDNKSLKLCCEFRARETGRAIMLSREFLRAHNFYTAILDYYSIGKGEFVPVCTIRRSDDTPSPDIQDPEQLSIGW